MPETPEIPRSLRSGAHEIEDRIGIQRIDELLAVRLRLVEQCAPLRARFHDKSGMYKADRDRFFAALKNQIAAEIQQGTPAVIEHRDVVIPSKAELHLDGKQIGTDVFDRTEEWELDGVLYIATQAPHPDLRWTVVRKDGVAAEDVVVTPAVPPRKVVETEVERLAVGSDRAKALIDDVRAALTEYHVLEAKIAAIDEEIRRDDALIRYATREPK